MCPTTNWVTKVSKLNEVEYPQNWISTVILLLAHNWKTLEEFWSCMNDFTVAAILILFSCVPLIFFFQHKTTCGRPKEHVGNREDNWMFLHNTAGKFSMGPNLIENEQNRKLYCNSINFTTPSHFPTPQTAFSLAWDKLRDKFEGAEHPNCSDRIMFPPMLTEPLVLQVSFFAVRPTPYAGCFELSTVQCQKQK